MSMRFCSFLRRGRCGGFSLVEAAIVLGVVGLIIGGIWVAARAVNENLKLSRGQEGLILIVRNIQNGMSMADAAALGNHISLHNTAIAADWIPSNWVSGGIMMAPFASEPFNYVVNWGPYWRFQLDFRYLTKAMCIKMGQFVINRYTSTNSGWANMQNSGGLVDVTVHSYDNNLNLVTNSGISAFPATISSAECSTEKNEIYFTWSYTRIN